MDREAWWATVCGISKELDTTELLNNSKEAKGWGNIYHLMTRTQKSHEKILRQNKSLKKKQTKKLNKSSDSQRSEIRKRRGSQRQKRSDK